MDAEQNTESLVVVAIVKTILPNDEVQSNSCVLSLSTLPDIHDRDYLIDVINVNTPLFCDDESNDFIKWYYDFLVEKNKLW